VKLGPNEAFIRIDLARVLWGQNRLKEAEWQAQEAALFEPDNPWSYAVLSWIAKDQGNEAENQRLIDMTHQKQSNKLLKTADDYREAGYLYLFIGRYEDADIYFNKAVKLGLNEFEMLIEMGWIYLERLDWQKARDAFSQAVNLHPDDYYVRNDLAHSLRKLGLIEDSINEYRKSITIESDNYRAHYYLWEIYYDQGELAKAIAELEIAVKLDMPSRIAPLFWKTLGIAYEQVEDKDKSLAAYEKAVELDPEDVIGHFLLASILKEQGKIEDAMKEARLAITLTKAKEDIGNLSLVHSLMAELYEYQNDFENAILEMQIAIENTEEPTDKAFYLWKLGILLTKIERADKAIDAFNQAIQFDDQNPYYYYNRGLVYARIDDLSRAMNDFRDAKVLAVKNNNQKLVNMIKETISQYEK